jgi:D-alanyl-D-alanine carboxypeptidase
VQFHLHDARGRLDRVLRVASALVLALAVAALPWSEALAKPRSRGPAIAASIVVDMNSNRILYAEGADSPRHPASLTKMMTLYMLFTYLRSGVISLNSDLVVTPFAASQSPTKLGIKPGTTIRTTDAINALVTLSANDVAVTVAENIAGTEQNFARMMTEKARSLGMNGTTFRNASGLPNGEQITTARDMAILAHHLIRDFPEYYSCFQTKYFTYRGRKYRNHNRLLFGYRGTDGIKTGFTRAAGYNLTASVRRGDKHLIAVVLGGRTGSQRDAAMRALLDASFPKASSSGSSAPLIASRDALAPSPVPAPTAPRRNFTLALAAPASNPLYFDKQEPEGSTVDETVAPPLPVPAADKSARQSSAQASTRKGPFHVQVGAYTNQDEAERRLSLVKERAAALLKGYSPVTTVFQKNDTQWYRARFAGFSKDGAASACDELKRMALDCVVMRAY